MFAVLRLTTAGLLTLFLAIPVLFPILALFSDTSGWSAWRDWERIRTLWETSALLACGAVMVAVPLGTIVAVILERCTIPGQTVIRGFVLAGIFTPLPVLAVAWQIILEVWLPPLRLNPGDVAWRPWAQGLLPASFVHGIAGFPWVIGIVAAGLRTTDPALEESARLDGGSRWVWRYVLLPRIAPVAILAALWVTLVCMTEIVVTDTMMVRTFGEEVYTQFVSASNGLAAAVAITVPAWLLAMVCVGWIVRATGRRIGEPSSDVARPVRVRHRSRRYGALTVTVWFLVTVPVGLPILALLGRAAGGGTANGWNIPFLLGEMNKVIRTDGIILLDGIGTASVVGLLTTFTAAMACRWAVRNRAFRRFLLILCVMLAVTPGPIVGIGLKQTIHQLMALEDGIVARWGPPPTFLPMRSMLYDQPSPVPAGWAAWIRLFPMAVLILWPGFRRIPRELDELATLDGLPEWGRWQRVLIPQTAPFLAASVLAVVTATLGEVSAGKLVNPPFRSLYTLRLFDQMHYGPDSTVAALALLQVVVMLILGGLYLWLLFPQADAPPSPG